MNIKKSKFRNCNNNIRLYKSNKKKVYFLIRKLLMKMNKILIKSMINNIYIMIYKIIKINN
jgi:hypothetical protein